MIWKNWIVFKCCRAQSARKAMVDGSGLVVHRSGLRRGFGEAVGRKRVGPERSSRAAAAEL